MRCFIVIILFLMMSHDVMSQTSKEAYRVKTKRLNMVEFHHVGMGLDMEANENYYMSPRLFYGIGSYRNLMNLDVGIRFKVSNPFDLTPTESLSVKYLNPFISVGFNPIRWNSGCVYSGFETSYCLVASASHRLSQDDIVIYDREIGRAHMHAKAMVGVKFNRWDVSVYYDHNLAPTINQKYIYESVDYDYDRLISGLYERYRIGVAVCYYIPF